MRTRRVVANDSGWWLSLFCRMLLLSLSSCCLLKNFTAFFSSRHIGLALAELRCVWWSWSWPAVPRSPGLFGWWNRSKKHARALAHVFRSGLCFSSRSTARSGPSLPLSLSWHLDVWRSAANLRLRVCCVRDCHVFVLVDHYQPHQEPEVTTWHLATGLTVIGREIVWLILVAFSDVYLSGCWGYYCVVDVGGICACFRRNSVKKFAETTSFALQEPAQLAHGWVFNVKGLERNLDELWNVTIRMIGVWVFAQTKVNVAIGNLRMSGRI